MNYIQYLETPMGYFVLINNNNPNLVYFSSTVENCNGGEYLYKSTSRKVKSKLVKEAQ